MAKDGRGGARPGAGRPRGNNEYISIRLPQNYIEYIRKAAKADNIPIGEWILQHLNVKELPV